MELLIRHHFRNLGNYYVTSFFQKLYDTLVQKYKNQINFKIVNSLEYENKGYGSIYSCMNMSIVNPINNKYILISFFDNWKHHFYKSLGWDPDNMVLFFYPSRFNYIDYYNFKYNYRHNLDIICPHNIKDIYNSFIYSMYNDINHNLIIDIFNKRKHNIQLDQIILKLYFHGTIFNTHYNNVREDVYANLKGEESIIFIDKDKDNNIENLQYLEDMAKYRAALSLPGGTEVCNRDIECFGVGVPVIRPHLDIQYKDPLISNYHYINCFHNCKYWDGSPSYINNKDLAAYILYYWNQIKDNTEYLEFISNNAHKWYHKNFGMKNNIKYILSKLNLELLYD